MIAALPPFTPFSPEPTDSPSHADPHALTYTHTLTQTQIRNTQTLLTVNLCFHSISSPCSPLSFTHTNTGLNLGARSLFSPHPENGGHRLLCSLRSRRSRHGAAFDPQKFPRISATAYAASLHLDKELGINASPGCVAITLISRPSDPPAILSRATSDSASIFSLPASLLLRRLSPSYSHLLILLQPISYFPSFFRESRFPFSLFAISPFFSLPLSGSTSFPGTGRR